MSNSGNASELDSLIVPEIKLDLFYKTIEALGRYAPIHHVLEIGSSSGEGSTEAWVKGMRDNPLKPRLYCLEVSKVRFEALRSHWAAEDFVKCYHGSSVGPSQFPSSELVERFLKEVDSPLRQYSVETVLGWLEQDKEYLRRENITRGCLARIREENGIKHFDAVLIDGSEFTGEAELDDVYGAEFILLDDASTYKNHANRARLLKDPGYELINEDLKLRNGFSVFRRRRLTCFDPLPEQAPVCFFTMVLNGMPFLKHHLEVMKQLPFNWCWHVVEGAAELKACTAWSVEAGGELDDSFHLQGLSSDGTTEWLDEVAAAHPGKVFVHRKGAGEMWQGKVEMVNVPVSCIFQDCLLWEIDADELWTVEQITEMRRLFLLDPSATAAWFWCWFFVGPEHVVSTRYCYSQNPGMEWLRVWRFRPGMKWDAHEPPVLLERCEGDDETWRDVASVDSIRHDVTARHGLVFQHYAYVTDEQLAFKERYYGYRGLTEQARALRAQKDLPCSLAKFFPWVQDRTQVDLASRCGVTPLAQLNEQTGAWTFVSRADLQSERAPAKKSTIVVDAVFFQMNNTGIGRVWTEILQAWSTKEIGARVVVLDRNGTAPRFPGLQYHAVAPYVSGRTGEDSLMLQTVCDELGAAIFLSTYYTAPISTPSLLMVYDMIGEYLGVVRSQADWFEKSLAILGASSFVAISESTRRDLVRMHPWIKPEAVRVAYCGISAAFTPASPEEIAEFRSRFGLQKDYVLVAGERVGLQGYKNVEAVFRAVRQLPEDRRRNLMILCAGGKPELERELAILAGDVEVKLQRFTDDDFRLAYAGAHVLVYPSLYEGFGMPVVEAMACGCPVITCRRASLPEAGGDAAIYVDPWDYEAISADILRLDDPVERARLVAAGRSQAAQFSYERKANIVAEAVEDTIAKTATASAGRSGVLWRNYRQLQEEKQTESIKNNTALAQQAGEKQSLEKRCSKLEKELEKLRKAFAKSERRLKEARQKKKPRWQQKLARFFGG